MGNIVLKNSEFYQFLHSVFTRHNISKARFEAKGNSMSPFIRNRDTITLLSAGKKNSLKVGDIVAVGDREEKQLLFIHRVIRTDPGRCQTKGDNNLKDDGWVSVEDVLGVVIKIKRVSGKTRLYKRWHHFIIAILSRYGLLNYFIVPALSFWGKRLKPSRIRA